MNKVLEYFLRAAPWALCLMMVVPYAVYKLTGFGRTPLEWGFLVIYFLAVVIGWIYSVGSTANDRLPPEHRLNPLPFRVAASFPFVALVVFVVAVLLPLVRGQITHPPSWVIFVHFGAIFSLAYCYWFAARQFITLRRGTEITFIDYYPAFMGFWFCFIGVWFLQPKVQETFSQR